MSVPDSMLAQNYLDDKVIRPPNLLVMHWALSPTQRVLVSIGNVSVLVHDGCGQHPLWVIQSHPQLWECYCIYTMGNFPVFYPLRAITNPQLARVVSKLAQTKQNHKGERAEAAKWRARHLWCFRYISSHASWFMTLSRILQMEVRLTWSLH